MKIATLTLNPALDRTMYFDDNIKIGALNRARKDRESITAIGGKGTNVSCMFKILGAESMAYGFIGGGNGDIFLQEFEKYGVAADFTRTICDTRMNIKIITDSGVATEFNEAGGIVSTAEKNELLNKIERELDSIDLFFMGGSAPLGVEKSIYRDIINLSRNSRTKFIADCDGELLRHCMNNTKKPLMIKPNQFELQEYSGKYFNLDEDFDGALEQVKAEILRIYNDTGVTVLCTLGEYGGLYCGAEGVFYKSAPKVKVMGFSGAGDTFLTAFCAAYFGLCDIHGAEKRQYTPKEALDFAVAASAAKVTKGGTRFPSIEEIYKFHCK